MHSPRYRHLPRPNFRIHLRSRPRLAKLPPRDRLDSGGPAARPLARALRDVSRRVAPALVRPGAREGAGDLRGRAAAAFRTRALRRQGPPASRRSPGARPLPGVDRDPVSWSPAPEGADPYRRAGPSGGADLLGSWPLAAVEPPRG